MKLFLLGVYVFAIGIGLLANPPLGGWVILFGICFVVTGCCHGAELQSKKDPF